MEVDVVRALRFRVSNTPTLEEARSAVRVVERYLYSVLGAAEEGSEPAREAQNQMRLAVGLRRKLDAAAAAKER